MSKEISFSQSSSIPRPPWATESRVDEYGLCANVWVPGTQVGFRMRSIPAGAFLMGSPEGEPGRWNPAGGDGDDWSPELKLSIPPTDLIEATHTVTLTQNFWILDTPVTQALWQAVMGDNPSFFISPDRPVEQVSWDDAMAFEQQLNLKIDGFEAQLLTEAQW
ncbi:MAG: SUMF1/EgtB/PvdO family nonheme iron enzyme, partial [Myxococcota bacterium]